MNTYKPVTKLLLLSILIIPNLIKPSIAQEASNSIESSQPINIPITPYPSTTSIDNSTNTVTNQSQINSPHNPTNQSAVNLPSFPTQIPAKEEISIPGNKTPIPPSPVKGNAIASDKSLPIPPTVSEPYRKPPEELPENEKIPENEINSNQTNPVASTNPVISTSTNNMTIVNNNDNNLEENISPKNNDNNSIDTNEDSLDNSSISPFDQTPRDEIPLSNSAESTKPKINSNSSPINSTKVENNPSFSDNKSVLISPAKISNNTSSTSNDNTINSSQRYVDSEKKRRTLGDILVFTPNNNPVNKNNVVNQISDDNSLIKSENNNSYKVFVSVANPSAETQIKSLYPDAFYTKYQGKKVLQIGLFSTKINAEQAIKSLGNNSSNAIIFKFN